MKPHRRVRPFASDTRPFVYMDVFSHVYGVGTIPSQRHDLNKICARHSLHEVHIDKFDQLDDMLVATLKV